MLEYSCLVTLHFTVQPKIMSKEEASKGVSITYNITYKDYLIILIKTGVTWQLLIETRCFLQIPSASTHSQQYIRPLKNNHM